MKRDSRVQRRQQAGDVELGMGRGPVIGLVAVVLVLVAAVAVFAVTRADDDSSASGDKAPPDICGEFNPDALGQAAIGLGLDGGTGPCDDFSNLVTAPDADTQVALRITYLNESDVAQQDVTLRLELPSELAPDTAATTMYDRGAIASSPMATGFLMWQSDGLRIGSYEPQESTVVVVYADLAGEFDAAGCTALRDPVKAFASSRGEDEVSATLSVQVGGGCEDPTT